MAHDVPYSYQKTCRDCYFFETEMRFGRQMHNCRLLGEQEDSPACAQFMDRETDTSGQFVSNEFLMARAAARAAAEDNDTALDMQAEMQRLLHSIYEEDKGCTTALESIKALLQQQGDAVTLDDGLMRRLEKDVERYSHLKMTRRLIGLYGLDAYERDIMGRKLDLLFPRPVSRQIAVPPKEEE